MSCERYLLIWNDQNWLIATINGTDQVVRELPVNSDSAPDEIADAVSEATGGTKNSVMLAVSSHHCLSAPLPPDTIAGSQSRVTLGYELEQVLPLAVEDFTADFIRSDASPCETLGVVIENSKLMPIVDALQHRGIKLTVITSASLLALQYLTRQSPFDGETSLVLWKNGPMYECFSLRKNKPLDWMVIAEEKGAIQRYTNAFLLSHPPASVRCVLVPEQSSIEVSPFPTETTVTTLNAPSVLEAAVAEAANVLNGRTTPWIDFLSAADPNRAIRPMLTIVTLSVVLLCVVVVVSFLGRAHRYHRLAKQIDHEQGTLFSEAFPGQPIPRAIVTRLTSERAKLGDLSGAVRTPDQQSALTTLYQVLEALPDEQEYQLLELQISQGGNVTLDGKASSTDAVLEVVDDLKASGFQVEAAPDLGGTNGVIVMHVVGARTTQEGTK